MLGRVGVVLVPLLLLALWLVRLRSPRAGSLALDPPRQGVVRVHERQAVGWRWAGLGLGVLVVAKMASVGPFGLGLMLAPTAFGLAVIAGVIVGELARTPRSEGVRTAALRTRSVGAYLPWRLGGVVVAVTVGLGAVLVTTTLMGSADEPGQAARSLVRACSPVMSASRGPWPGLFYSLPLGIAVAVGLVGAVVALRTVVLRPPIGSGPDLVAADDVLRRRSAEAVVAATGVMVAASLLGIAATAGTALISFACPPTSWTVLGVVLLAVAALMLILGVWCLTLLLSGPRRPLTESGERAVSEREVRR